MELRNSWNNNQCASITTTQILPVVQTFDSLAIRQINSFVSMSLLVLYGKGRGVSRSRRIRNTSRFSATSVSSAVSTPRQDQAKSKTWSRNMVRDRPLGRFRLGAAKMTCLANPFLGILVRWPNHRSWDLSTWRRNGSRNGTWRRNGHSGLPKFYNCALCHFVLN